MRDVVGIWANMQTNNGCMDAWYLGCSLTSGGLRTGAWVDLYGRQEHFCGCVRASIVTSQLTQGGSARNIHLLLLNNHLPSI
jgi:hypothetical protein